MTKKIVLFGAGKSASCLIKYLLKECAANDWRLIVADNNLSLALSKVGSSATAKAVQINVEDTEQRSDLVKECDLVISLLPPALHFLVANDCLLYGKDLLTASYLDEKITSLSTAIKNNGLFFLCEMGLDPGIDHMSAMHLVHRIKEQGGQIVSFKSHCGGLLAPESDNNPWRYKISWNPRNVVRAGSSGAVFKENNMVTHLHYGQLFDNCKEVSIPGLQRLAYYPNRDSLEYMKLYQLENVDSFIRTTLRYPEFCIGWSSLVHAGLTSDTTLPDTENLTVAKWAEPVLQHIKAGNQKLFEYLGFFEEQAVPVALKSSADILQYLLEKKLMMQPADKDMIVMFHEIEYLQDDILHKTESLLMLKGHDNIDTAMAKTVGLPLGIAASLILKGVIELTGLHIPILPEIYIPVLKELEMQGIRFEERTLTNDG